MSFKKIGSRYDKDLKEWLEQFEAEYERDLSALPEANPGSTCYVKETGKTVVMGNNGVWGGGSAELPFGETTTVKEVLAECQPEYVATGDSAFKMPDGTTLTLNETYIVNWNGVDYECSTQTFDGYVVLGNVGGMTGGVDTGEPFAIQMFDSALTEELGYCGVAMPLDGSTTLTISIRQEVTEVQKISGKYVEGMGYEEDGVVHPINPKFLPSGGGGTKLYHDSYNGKTYTDEQLANELAFSDAVNVKLPVTIALYSQGGFTGTDVSVVANMVVGTTVYFFYVAPTDENGGFEMCHVKIMDKSGPM